MKKVILVGNVSQDPEIRNVNGKNYVSFNVASTEGFGKKAQSEFYQIMYSARDGVNYAEVFNKGREVYIEGRELIKTSIGQDGRVFIDKTIWANEVMGLRGGRVEKDPNAQTQPQTQPQPQPLQQKGNVIYANQQPADAVQIFPDRHNKIEEEDADLPF